MIKNKYYKWYYNIIDKARSRNSGNDRHHIVPKSIGGTDDETNLVLLTYKEHYVCHHLLTKFTIGKDWHKMIYAFKWMTEVRSHRITSSVYENMKRDFKKVVSATHKGKTLSQDTRRKIREARARQAPASQETRRKMSEAKKGKLEGKNNPMYGKKHSKETIEKMKVSRAGINHPEVTGHYITPWGEFLTARGVSDAAPVKLNETSIRRWCRTNNLHKIRKQSFLQCEYLNMLGVDVIGKTFKELGFSFRAL